MILTSNVHTFSLPDRTREVLTVCDFKIDTKVVSVCQERGIRMRKSELHGDPFVIGKDW